VEISPVTVSTGGCAPNTGGTLHRLGSRVRLVGRVGDDPLSGIVRRMLAADGLDGGIWIAPGESSSHSIIQVPLARTGCYSTSTEQTAPSAKKT
jgi:sugar/nucleoside kinase (ribokinase family)